MNLLKKKAVSTYSLEEKKEIKNVRILLPNLDVKQQEKDQIRKLNPNLYEKNSWLYGCGVMQVFCFPCVLFGGDITCCRTFFR